MPHAPNTNSASPQASFNSTHKASDHTDTLDLTMKPTIPTTPMHNHTPTRLLLASLCTLLFAAAAVAAPRPEKPNVILMLTDDLGWQDVKCYDIDEPSPYETPNLDAMAKRGVLFHQAYSPAPTCSPSRCAIMAGKHPARIQKTHVLGGQPRRAVEPLARTGAEARRTR